MGQIEPAFAKDRPLFGSIDGRVGEDVTADITAVFAHQRGKFSLLWRVYARDALAPFTDIVHQLLHAFLIVKLTFH
jgi:hypothetical protein